MRVSSSQVIFRKYTGPIFDIGRGRRAFKGGTGMTTARPSDLHPGARGKITARLLAAHDNFVEDGG
jgi:hypothetical protein